MISYATPLGGAQRSLHATIDALKDDIEYKIVIPGKGEVYDLYQDMNIHLDSQGKGINVYGKKLHTYSRFKKMTLFFKEYLPYQLRMLKLIRSFNPDIIHSNSGRSILFNYIALRLSGKPIINHIRGKFVPDNKRVIRNFAICDKLITVSKSIKNDYFKDKDKHKAVPIYNGVEPNKIFTESKVNELVENDKVIFGCFSNIVPFKGYHHLIDAMEILNNQGFNEKYKVVCLGKFPSGYETYHDFLKSKINKSKINNLQFLGFQKNPFPYYNTVDITLLPSVSNEELEMETSSITIRGNEGLPRVLIESMVFKNPLIASKIEGVPEMIDEGKNGFMIPPANPMILAEKMKYFIENHNLIESMGEISRDLFDKRFHIKKNRESILKLYYELI
jgi:glycosyltransferase involved in cell wall biosynthesis